MCASINCKTHIIAIGVLIAASGISLIQCNWHDSHGSYPSANDINHHHHHHHQHERYTTQNPVSTNGKFEEIYRWKQISYALLDSDNIVFGPTDKHRNDLTASEIQADFIPYNNLPMGVTHHKDRLFITLPRRRIGMPATIAYVRTNGMKGSSPSLQAYPNYRTNQVHPQRQPDRNRIVSVYRSHVDPCNRLWFVDTGSLEYPNNIIQVQPPSIWIFDLNTDTLIRRFEIPTNIITAGQGIASITVDIDDNRCNEVYAYLPDLVNYRLHVYSYRENSLWSFSHNSLSFDPIHSDFDVNGVQFQWQDGIFSIQLSNRNPDGFKTAYFHAMASTSEFAVSTEILRNQTLVSRSYHGNDFRYLGQRSAAGQSATHAYDEDSGVLFYTQVALNGIGCWNVAKPLTDSNFHIIAQDNTTMIYPSDISIDADGDIWFMTNNLPFYNYASIDPNVYNYRIWKASVREILQSSPC